MNAGFVYAPRGAPLPEDLGRLREGREDGVGSTMSCGSCGIVTPTGFSDEMVGGGVMARKVAARGERAVGTPRSRIGDLSGLTVC